MNIKEIKKEIERKENELKTLIEIQEKELNELKVQIKNVATYETIIILNTNTSIKEYGSIKREIIKMIDNENINNVEEIGTKKLAYEISKQKEGFYTIFDYDGIIQTVEELEKYFRINDNILKFITIKKGD